MDYYKDQLLEVTIQGLTKLFKTKMSSMVQAHEALVEMAGAGGAEFLPDAAQEVVV